MRIIISFIALFASISLLQLSSGAIGPLDVLSGISEGFTDTEIGLLGSAHFLGFFVGCWWAPRLMGTVGHSRAFSAFAATGAIGAIAHPMLIDPIAWAFDAHPYRPVCRGLLYRNRGVDAGEVNKL